MLNKILMKCLWETQWFKRCCSYHVPPPSRRTPVLGLTGSSWSQRMRTGALGWGCDQSLIELLPLAPFLPMAGSRPAALKALTPIQEAGAFWVVVWNKPFKPGAKNSRCAGSKENFQVQSSKTESILQMTWAAKIISFCVFSPWCRTRAVVSGTARAGTHRPCWEMKEPTSKWAVGSWERG